jgi:hypothetical protein
VVEKHVELSSGKITISISNSLVADNPSLNPLGDLIRAEIQVHERRFLSRGDN